MVAKKCNRCGEFFDVTDNHLILSIAEAENRFETPGFNIDLCEKCKDEFYDFLNRYEEVEKDEKK